MAKADRLDLLRMLMLLQGQETKAKRGCGQMGATLLRLGCVRGVPSACASKAKTRATTTGTAQPFQ
jgi:hypothetical protein